jgi:YHS domain-containing protein
MKSTETNLDPRTSDPVCGRHISEAQALLCAEYEGTTYLFCSERCRMLFAIRPGAFAVRSSPWQADEAPE